MIGLLTIVAIGFLLGIRHATDPDHVIAVSTIVSHEHSAKRSAVIGAAWGVGHTVTIMAVGGVIILFRIALPPRVGLGMEMAVGVMLIVLGVKNIGGLFSWPAEWAGAAQALDPKMELPQYHSHGDYIHAHPHPQGHGHPHDPQRNPVSAMDRWFDRYGLYHLLRPLVVGIIHGLAGSAAIALLVLTTIRNTMWAFVYLAVFGAGTVGGMVLITTAIAAPFAFCSKVPRGLNLTMRAASGLFSLGFGLFLAYQIGFVNGLFTAHPLWVPH